MPQSFILLYLFAVAMVTFIIKLRRFHFVAFLCGEVVSATLKAQVRKRAHTNKHISAPHQSQEGEKYVR